MSGAELTFEQERPPAMAWRGLRLALGAAYACLCAGGIVSYAFMGGPPPALAWTAPLYLALAGALVLAFTPLNLWHWPMLAAVLGLASELCGVAFGFPYGQYEYTHALGPAWLGVPLVLACAWLVLVAHVQGAMQAWRVPKAARPFVGAAWMTAIDLVIDPLAAGPLGYWRWIEGGAYFGIPASNFAGWFVVSLLIFALLPSRWQPGRPLVWLGASVVAFFALLALLLGFPLPGALGLLLLVLGLCSHRLKS